VIDLDMTNQHQHRVLWHILDRTFNPDQGPPAMLSDYESDLAAQTTLRDKLHVAKIYGGMPWVMAAIHVAGVGKLSSMSPEQAARVFAIPLPPATIDVFVTAEFLHDWREYLYRDGPPPTALLCRDEGERWLCGIVDMVRS
jgi:hypothetical protein